MLTSPKLTNIKMQFSQEFDQAFSIYKGAEGRRSGQDALGRRRQAVNIVESYRP
jgi:hypothetical protein